MKRRPAVKRPVQVELTRNAIADLQEIERYSLDQWGRRAADRYLSDIEAALDRIRERPDVLRLEPEFAPGLHFYRVNKHLLVCDTSPTTVIVLTVIHTSMDIPTRLHELEPQLAAEVQLLRARLNRDRGSR
jgi:toxin ParE1/3/4